MLRPRITTPNTKGGGIQMKQFYRYTFLFALILTIGVIFAFQVESATAGSARVTFLSGKGFKSKNKNGPWAAIAKGGTISAGYYVKADAGAKIELTLPDNSKMRVGPGSILFLSSAKLTQGTRKVEATVVQGTVYTKATPAKKKGDEFTVRSGSAVAGIRGTAFNTILMPDGATEVKCFEGKVWVATWADYAQKFLREPQQIPTEGPLDAPVVPGPEVVTEEEWVRIAGAMMSVTVGADGKVSDPSQFSDTSDWEEWNQKRDAM